MHEDTPAACDMSAWQHEPADRLLVRALQLIDADRPAQALPLLEHLHRHQPAEPAHAINLANARLACADIEGALAAFDVARRIGGTGVACWLGHGLALLAARRFPQAGPLLERAFRLQPEAPDVALGWAQYLVDMERFDEARACMAGAEISTLPPAQRRAGAWLLAQCGLEAQALRLFDTCLREAPDDVPLRVQYALLLERLNRIEDAGEQLEAAQATGHPLDGMHALALARWQRRTGRAHEALRTVHAALPRVEGDEMSAQLQFEHARLQDHLGDSDAAMTALASAHASAGRAFRCRRPDADAGALLGWLQQRLHAPAPPHWQEPLPDNGPRDPVFLVGFPRSGTTLLQHVLGMHPDIRALVEKPVLEDVICLFRLQPPNGPHTLLAMLDAATPANLAMLRAAYRRGVEAHSVEDGRWLLDKYPLSMTRIPYIARLFPRSRTLCLLRHPCDVVLSCHMQAFGLNGGALAFASLASTARTYVQVMAYWEEQQQRVACAIHTLRYEDMVADLPAVMHGITRFLGLAWCDGFQDFHQQARRQHERIRTPSYSQVVRPVNADAVHRWHAYRRHFEGEVLDLLAPFAARYGYSLG